MPLCYWMLMAGSDPKDPLSAGADAHKQRYSKLLSTQALKGVRLGVLRGMHSEDADVKPVFQAALAVLKAQGAVLVDIDTSGLEDVTPIMRKVLLADFKHDVNAYLAGAPPEVKTRTLADLIEFNRTEEHEKLHSQETFEASELTHGVDDEDYKSTLETLHRKTRAEGIDRLLRENNVVALVSLTNTPAAVSQPDGTPSRGVTAERPVSEKSLQSMTGYAAAAEYPHLTVPIGLAKGLPVGMSLIGPQWSEASLLSYGYAYEQAAHARVPPGPGPYGPKANASQ